MLFYTYLPNEPLSKDRVEAFSDGVYAIVATLLILDIWFVALLFLLLSVWDSCDCCPIFEWASPSFDFMKLSQGGRVEETCPKATLIPTEWAHNCYHKCVS